MRRTWRNWPILPARCESFFWPFPAVKAVGFAEISERSVVAGAGNGPAAYLEGWYVDPGVRRCGVGAALVAAAADWARQQGYRYFGSDVELANTVSQKAHEALGFAETGRVVTYAMALS